jgi:hypothetical protein
MGEPIFNVTANFELQISNDVLYYKDINGVYEDSSRNHVLCEEKDCETKGGFDIPKREVHATYKIKNNEFIISSVSVTKADQY